MKNAAVFLEELWGGKDKDRGHILVWDAEYVSGENRLKNSRSSWANTVENCEKLIVERSQVTPPREVYLGCGLRQTPLGSTKRGGIKTIVGVPGIWAEIDFGKSHAASSKDYPDDEKEALEIVKEMQLKPTLIVHSGHGFHLWWLFKDVWYFDSDEERQQFVELIRDWQGTLCAHAEARGKSIDSTFDLARVLRIPGTTNHKRADLPILVEIYQHNKDARYAEDDFAEFITVRGVDTEEIGNAGGPVSFSEDANPPVEKLDRLKKANAKFRASWERRRTDFSDQSGSSYCYSLAYYALAAGWSEQEIVNLLISWRRKYNEPLKLDRPTWYLNYTIWRARANLKENRRIEESINRMAAQDEPIDRETILENASMLLNNKVVGVIKHGEENAIVSFELWNGKTVELGTMAQVCQIRTIRWKLLEKTHKIIPAHVTEQTWFTVLERLLSICRVVNPEEGDRVEELVEWLMDYCLATNMASDAGEEDEIEAAIYDGRPFCRYQTNEWWVRLRGFHQWLKMERLTRLTQASLASTFNLAGFRPKRTKGPIDRHYWVGNVDQYRKTLDDIERRSRRA